jgi:hypothetical protein
MATQPTDPTEPQEPAPPAEEPAPDDGEMIQDPLPEPKPVPRFPNAG